MVSPGDNFLNYIVLDYWTQETTVRTHVTSVLCGELLCWKISPVIISELVMHLQDVFLVE